MVSIRRRRPQPAYIFGGLEALILQGLIGGILGGLFVLKGYWRRVKAFFSGTSEEHTPVEQTEGKESEH
jgi:hypothetical protein